MSRGLPDFGMYAVKSALASMADNGELAARLGALSRYDRLGDVIFFEDFCSDLGAWEVETSGALSSAVVTAERSVSGGFSLKLTADSALLRYAGVRGRFPVPYSVMYGLEVLATPHANIDYSDLGVDIYTGAYHIAFGIRFGYADKENYYYKAPGDWRIIPGGLSVLLNDHLFVAAKFTFNMSTQKYSRLLLPPRPFDLSDYSGYIEESAEFPRMECWGRVYSKAATVAVSYIDNVIITANDV